MRQAFAHDAVLELADGADQRGPGGAVTVALCGALDHEPPCPVAPHHTAVTGHGRRRQVRVLFATDNEPMVRRIIETALRNGEFVGPDGVVSRWVLRSSGPGSLADVEAGHAARLIES